MSKEKMRSKIERLPSLSFDSHIDKVMELLTKMGGTTTKTAIENHIDIHGGALHKVIFNMKLYNLMDRVGQKYSFTNMSKPFLTANDTERKRIYAKAMLFIPIFKKIVSDKDFSNIPKFSDLRKIFSDEYKVQNPQDYTLANVFISNWKFLGVQFSFFKGIKDERIPYETKQPETTTETFEGMKAQMLSIELLYAVSKPRSLDEIVNDIIKHRNDFSNDKQILIDALEKSKHDSQKLKIIVETLADSLAGVKSKIPSK